MLKRYNMQWTVKTFVNQIERDKVNFDCSVQRGYVWDIERKSLYIHSYIEGYPIPPFFFVKNDDGIYDALDGKQRGETSRAFLSDEFSLSNSTPVVFDEDGNEFDISGMKFSELPEFAQQNIKDYSLTIYYFEGITQEEVSELFFRLNNGKPLSSIELTRVKAKSLEAFQEIAEHPAMKFAITEKGRKNYTDEQLAMQMWTVCFTENPSFVTKVFRPMIENVEVTTNQMKTIKDCLDYVMALYEYFDPETKEDMKILRKIKAKTHLVTLVHLANNCINRGIIVDRFISIAKRFFSASKGASINEEYNTASRHGSSKPENIRKRLEASVNSIN